MPERHWRDDHRWDAPPKVRFATDSPLEGAGFEPSVPLRWSVFPNRGRPNELGPLLADLRTAKRLSLRQVEEATGKAVSNAYLSQLENGKIHKPSPNVLHSLSGVYA